MVTGSCGIGQNDMVVDRAVMGDVAVGHDERVIADAGQASALCSAAIDGDKFADGVVVADFEARGFALVAQVLRGESDGGEWEEAIAGADLRRAFDYDVRNKFAVFAECDVRADGAVRADLAGSWDFCGGSDYGCGMNTH